MFHIIHDCVTVVRAFRSSPEAQAECVRLNLEGSEDGGKFEVVEFNAAPGDIRAYALALVKSERAMDALVRAREEGQRAALGALLAGSVKLFQEHPDLQSFSWLQVIESWHEPWCEHADEDCEFKVHFETPDINGVDGGELEAGDGLELETELQPHVADFLRLFAAGDMLAMFGVDVRVTAYRDGRVEVEEI